MIPASDLATKKFKGIQLPAPYGEVLGSIPPNISIVIWGPKGSLKSTMAIDLGNVLAGELGKGIYCSSEEGVGPGLQNKINRLDAKNPDLYITDYDTLAKLKAEIEMLPARFVILDSISMSYIRPEEFRRFMEFCKHKDCMLIYILHATKDGKYKGPTEFVHWPDAEIKVEDGIAHTEKNRFEETPKEMKVIASRKRKNPSEKSKSSNYEEYFDLYKKGKLVSGKKLLVGNPNSKLIEAGLPAKSIQITQSVLRKTIDKHNVPLSDLEKLPELINYPIFVFKSKSEPNSFIIVTELFHNEKPIVAAIKIHMYKNGTVINDIRSLHPKDIFKLEYWIKEGLMLYEDKQKSPTLFAKTTPSNSGSRQIRSGYVDKISKKQNKNNSSHPNSERDKKKKGRRGGRKNPAGQVPSVPIPRDPLTYIGTCEKITIDNPAGLREMEGSFPMFVSLKKDRLYIIPPEYVHKVKQVVDNQKAEANYAEWHHFEPDQNDFEIQWPKKGTKAVPVGTADTIWYASDKMMQPEDHKGKINYYKHEFDRGKRPASVLGHVLVISLVKVDGRGILN